MTEEINICSRCDEEFPDKETIYINNNAYCKKCYEKYKDRLAMKLMDTMYEYLQRNIFE